MMVRTAAPERMLSDVERELLEQIAAAPLGSDARATWIQKHAGKWTWEYKTLHAPRMYDTRREALEMFDRYVATLQAAAQVERDSTYQVEPRVGRRDG